MHYVLQGRTLKVSSAQVKNRLFIGNDAENLDRDRGFAFLDYYNVAYAEYVKRKMSNPKFKLDNSAPTVSCADPKNHDNPAAFSQLPKITDSVYAEWNNSLMCGSLMANNFACYLTPIWNTGEGCVCENLPKGVTQNKLKELFESHGEITKVVLPSAKKGQENANYGFIPFPFAQRAGVVRALKNTEKYEIDGQVLECSLAEPQIDKCPNSGLNSHKAGLLLAYPGCLGYGMDPYDALGARYVLVLVQPMIYGRGPTPAGMTMVPMLLPDGWLGYVF
ncbi:hypothetical protein AMTRI_Chr11g96550 [Amborella trichopoda]